MSWISIRRRIEWMDTDAAGIYHWTTVFRLAEAAEAALHTALGIADRTFGATPRLRATGDFHMPLRFNDVVDVRLEVTRVGRSSLTQTVEVTRDGALAAEAEIVLCLIDRETGRATPWPDDLRSALGRDGRVEELPA
jgi:acyl-CoA thioester hydrolase